MIAGIDARDVTAPAAAFYVEKVLKDGTTLCRCNLADGYPLLVEVRASTAKEMEMNGVPPFIAIAADGVLEPTAAPGATVDDAVLEVLERLNQRYV